MSTTWTRERIQQLAAELQALPRVERVTTADALRALAPAIRAARAAGYTWLQLAEQLRERGLRASARAVQRACAAATTRAKARKAGAADAVR